MLYMTLSLLLCLAKLTFDKIVTSMHCFGKCRLNGNQIIRLKGTHQCFISHFMRRTSQDDRLLCTVVS